MSALRTTLTSLFAGSDEVEQGFCLFVCCYIPKICDICKSVIEKSVCNFDKYKVNVPHPISEEVVLCFVFFRCRIAISFYHIKMCPSWGPHKRHLHVILYPMHNIKYVVEKWGFI